MEILIIPALIVVLVVLVAVWNAQRENGGRSPEPADEATEPVDRPAFAPPSKAASAPPTDAPDRSISPLEWESLKIARAGETRASGLDFFGYIVIALAVLTAGAAAVAVLGDYEELSETGRAAIILSAFGTVLVLAAVASLVRGFAALVRNSSRLLAMTVDQGGGRH